MRESMEIYPRTAAERAMKLQEVLLRATAGKIKWWQAAELSGISDRQMRRWRKRYEEQGYQGLLDRRRPQSISGAPKFLPEILIAGTNLGPDNPQSSGGVLDQKNYQVGSTDRKSTRLNSSHAN